MSNKQPLVSIVCLCHNQAPYVKACLESVAAQDYQHIQLIIVDDASTDGSQKVIGKMLEDCNWQFSQAPLFISLEENMGNCRAFNKGLKASQGAYVIDLAADDLMSKDRVSRQVEFFERFSESYGVIYGDAALIDSKGGALGIERVVRPVTGDAYADVLARYFIPPPTMMIRKSILDTLGGYDETLAYEDFDFWVRSARICQYAYQPEALTTIRKVRGSLSSRFYEQGSPLADSTYTVCLKAFDLNETPDERQALARRIRYERRQCALLGNRSLAKKFGALLDQTSERQWADRWTDGLIAVPIYWGWLLRLRHVIRRRP
ncbi:MAG: glycosyltransferase [Bacteroidota bacterium]